MTRPLHSWNPLWANLHEWVELADMAWHAPRWRDKVKIWFMPLGWTPPGLPEGPRAQQVTRATLQKFDPQLPLGLNLYVLTQFAVTLVLSVAVLLLSDSHAPLSEILFPTVFVLWSLGNLGGVLERKRWALAAEVLRLAALPWGVASVVTTSPSWLPLAAGSAFAVVLAAWLLRYRGEFTASSPAPARNLWPAHLRRTLRSSPQPCRGTLTLPPWPIYNRPRFASHLTSRLSRVCSPPPQHPRAQCGRTLR